MAPSSICGEDVKPYGFGFGNTDNTILEMQRDIQKLRDEVKQMNSNHVLDRQLFQDKVRDVDTAQKKCRLRGKNLDKGMAEMKEQLGHLRGDFKHEVGNLRGDFQRDKKLKEEELKLVKAKLGETCDFIVNRMNMLRSEVCPPSSPEPNEVISNGQGTSSARVNEGTRKRFRESTPAATGIDFGKRIRLDCQFCGKNLAKSYITVHQRKHCKIANRNNSDPHVQ